MPTSRSTTRAGLATLVAFGLAAFASAGEPAPRAAVAKAPRGVAPTSSRAPLTEPVTKPGPKRDTQPAAKVGLRRAPRVARDPFAPPPALRAHALPAATTRGVSTAGDPLAGLEIRALIVLRGGRSGAVLAQKGRRWLVRPGDRFPTAGLSAEVRVIDRQGIELQLRDAAGTTLGPTRRVRQ
tara:strand:+ start:87 stop:632 length:546 start_codon:yes stop_codon:yes gene_type:complete